MRIITIGGNIGCGKSTLLTRLSNEYETYKEPIEKWGSWLDLFYTNPERYAFSFQMKILHDFMYFPLHGECDQKVVVTERSPLDSLYVFCKSMKDSKTITHMEYNLFKDYVDTIGWKPSTFVYLKTTPSVCLQRMRERARDCETGVDLEYIEKIHNAYESFVATLKQDPTVLVYEIDANLLCADEVYDQVVQKIETKQ